LRIEGFRDLRISHRRTQTDPGGLCCAFQPSTIFHTYPGGICFAFHGAGLAGEKDVIASGSGIEVKSSNLTIHVLGGICASNEGLRGNIDGIMRDRFIFSKRQVEGLKCGLIIDKREGLTMSRQLMDYKEKVIRELGNLSKEKIDEVIDFIGYLRSKEDRRRKDKKIDTLDSKDNALLSLIGIGESNPPHDLAENHDKYVYGDL